MAYVTISATGEFEWIDFSIKEDWADFILKQKNEQEEGYFLEVDLEYLDEVHDLHYTYQCTPEKLNIGEKHISEHQKKVREGAWS